MKLAKNLLILSFVCLTLSFTLFSAIRVSATTFVSGVISEDTTWGLNDSPYTLTGNILVQSGATLTIEPGVEVDFAAYYLQIEGTLRAIGTSQNRIIFSGVGDAHNSKGRISFEAISTDWSEGAGIGSVLEFFNISSIDSWAIQIDDECTPKISNGFFNMEFSTQNHKAIFASNGIIVNNTISNSNPAIQVGSGNAGVEGYPTSCSKSYNQGPYLKDEDHNHRSGKA